MYGRVPKIFGPKIDQLLHEEISRATYVSSNFTAIQGIWWFYHAYMLMRHEIICCKIFDTPAIFFFCAKKDVTCNIHINYNFWGKLKFFVTLKKQKKNKKSLKMLIKTRWKVWRSISNIKGRLIAWIPLSTLTGFPDTIPYYPVWASPKLYCILQTVPWWSLALVLVVKLYNWQARLLLQTRWRHSSEYKRLECFWIFKLRHAGATGPERYQYADIVLIL